MRACLSPGAWMARLAPEARRTKSTSATKLPLVPAPSAAD